MLINVFRYSALMLTAVTQSYQFRILKLGFCWKCLRSKLLSKGEFRLHKIQQSLQFLLYVWIFLLCCPGVLWICWSYSDVRHVLEENKYCCYYYYYYWSLYKLAIKKSLGKFGFNNEQISFTSESRMLTDVWEEVYMQSKEGLVALMLILGKYLLFCSFLDFYQ